MPIALEARHLVKQYPGVTAVNDVSFAVAEGICFGLLGPNGAGKTTTVEIIEGVTKPTSGEVRYYGEPAGDRFREEAGIQFQNTALQDYLTVRETLEMFRDLYDRQADIDEILEACSLTELADRDNRKLSGGQRQRLLLGVALVNRPRLIFLDEPTTGLDPQARRNFWELVQGILAKGATVILTTHYMDEAHVLCDEIAIMDAGRIIAQGQFDTRVPTRNMKGDVENLAVAFNTMLDRIQALVAGMQEVTDNIAHDLRSPIARIRAAAELALHDVKDPEEYTAVMAHTIRECDRLLSMVETMLFISEIESGTRASRKEDVDLAFLVHEACDLFQPLAEDKRIALSVQQSTPTCHIAGEPATLQRMIANLLDNALKYTGEGGHVTVRLEAMRNEAILVFEDNGIGISPENLPHIFDRFYRCDKSRHQSGTGLGLNLARAIVLEHDGDIHVSSQYGQGTVVTVRLPQTRTTS